MHTDFCSVAHIRSLGGSRYSVLFIDECSKYSWVYAIKEKSDVSDTFKPWLTTTENQHNQQLKVFQSDNRRDYVSLEMRRFVQGRGIVQRLTTPRNSYQNRVAERLNGT